MIFTTWSYNRLSNFVELFFKLHQMWNENLFQNHWICPEIAPKGFVFVQNIKHLHTHVGIWHTQVRFSHTRWRFSHTRWTLSRTGQTARKMKIVVKSQISVAKCVLGVSTAVGHPSQYLSASILNTSRRPYDWQVTHTQHAEPQLECSQTTGDSGCLHMSRVRGSLHQKNHPL